MATITIKTAYDNIGKQYWFAQNEQGKTFGQFFMGNYGFWANLTPVKWQFETIEDLKECIEEYKKSEAKEEVV